MCSINGCVDFCLPHTIDKVAVRAAGRALAHRGPDAHGEFFAPSVGFYHNRLAIMDPARGTQPMQATHDGKTYTIIYNGEIYNCAGLRRELLRLGAVFVTDCDTEVVLWSYIFWGEKCPTHLNGIFAFAVYDPARECVFFARDRLGVKPFFYTRLGTKFYFASEVKALFAHPEITPALSREGLWQLLYLSPVTLPGSGVFAGIDELLPAHAGRMTKEGFETWAYWQLEARECRDDAKTAAATVRELFCDAVHRQLNSDVPLAVLLSGGLDSSAITAVAAEHLREHGQTLSTYSFEYEGNRESFRPTLFQPQGDDAYAAQLATELGTAHTVLTAPTEAVAAALPAATLARDLAGQADIDSSLLYFCREIKKRHTVLLSGECSDEIFGGYPWFYRPEMLYRDFFPWLHDPHTRISLFDERITHANEGLEYLREVCRQSTADCPRLSGESAEDETARVATWLSTRYFMTNLLARKDRMSMYSAVEVRVPFADHRILEYVFNVPWRIKFENGVEKALLRRAMEGYLPDRVLWRKKSPYPKTHNPAYEQTVRRMLEARLAKKGSFLAEHLDRHRLQALLDGENETWQGQLMARPQLIAWLCQFSDWFESYHVKLI
ncbi:MAG: asparagine synthase (glutamine-hydrolyzing) [Ruminococcaceae bacterium]|nr:asparagine synthase (glutamine-hydrolyzing) [Oscillospiraceae bacterium]